MGPKESSAGPSKAAAGTSAAATEQSAAALRLSCAECRRRKLKCDRKVPCNKCISRGCGSLCPDGVLTPRNAIRGSVYGSLQDRVTELEALLEQHGIEVPSERKRKGKAKAGPTADRRAGAANDDEGSTQAGGGAAADEDEDDWIQSVGKLELGKAGGARFVGATAGSLWLSDEHMPSDEPHFQSGSGSFLSFLPMALKPHSSDGGPSTYAQLRARLPPQAEALYLVNLYYTQYSWLHSAVSQSTLLSHFEAFYSPHAPLPHSNDVWTNETHPHKLALLFVSMALGAYYDRQRSADEGKAQAFHAMSIRALELSSNEPTVASLQTLHIMANYLLSVVRIKGGDLVWGLFGTLMRQAVAMGMHRDSQRWDLPPPICDERRRIWWEICTEDSMQSNCFGRPSGLLPKHVDTMFPEEVDPVLPVPGDDPLVGYSTCKYKMGRLTNEVLDQVMCVTPPSYAEVKRLSQKISAFEKAIPYFLRCRPALLDTTSAYPTHEAAIQASPEVKTSDLRLTFQQHALALSVCEAQFFLLRPFFARALHENPADPSKSKYSEAFLCVTERCSIMVKLLMSLQELYPTSTPRQWFFWTHASSAAVALAFLIIRAPQSPLALFSWMNLQSACDLFSSSAALVKSTTTSLPLLLKLRQRALDALVGRRPPLTKVPSRRSADGGGDASENDEEDDSSSLIGIHTRLVERGNQGMARSKVVKGNGRSPSPLRQRSEPSPPAHVAGPPSSSLSVESNSQPQVGENNMTFADFIDSDPFAQPTQQQSQQQPVLPASQAESFLLSYSQVPAPDLPIDMDAVDEQPDVHTASILNSLWAPQDNEWSTGSHQVDWEGLSHSLGIDFLASGQQAPPPTQGNPDAPRPFSGLQQ